MTADFEDKFTGVQPSIRQANRHLKISITQTRLPLAARAKENAQLVQSRVSCPREPTRKKDLSNW